MYIYIYNLLVNLYMQLTISSCYGLIRLTLGLKGGDGGLSTLCHTCRFTVYLSAEGAKSKNVSCSDYDIYDIYQ